MPEPSYATELQQAWYVHIHEHIACYACTYKYSYVHVVTNKRFGVDP